MTFITIAGVVLCCWTFLSILGGERQQRVREIEAEAPPPPPTDDAPTSQPPQ